MSGSTHDPVKKNVGERDTGNGIGPGAAGVGSGNSSLTLKGVTVIDTRTGGLLAGMMVVIESGRISRIVPQGRLLAKETQLVIEAGGKFVVPGFLDMHAHVLEDDGESRTGRARREDTLNLMLAHGITGWRQMNGSAELLEQRKQQRLFLAEAGPELLAMPGQILTPANAGSPGAAVAEVWKQKSQGADFIKTIAVSPKAFFASLREAKRNGLPYAGHLSLGVSAIEAAEAGMRAIEHLGPIEMQLMSCSKKEWLIRTLLRFVRPKLPDLSPEKMETVGKLIVANPTLFRLQMDPKGLKRTEQLLDSFNEQKCCQLAKTCVVHGTWQVPTLIRIETMQLAEEPRFAEDPNLRFIPKNTRRFWSGVAHEFATRVMPEGKKTLERLTASALRMTKIFEDCGVKMLAGSDYGGMWVIAGVSLHQEFDLLAKAGLSPLRVLQMTTLNGAEFLGRLDTMGTVEVGKNANLVLLDRNPLENVENLHGIHAVVRNGRYHSKEALEALKERVAERVAAAPDAG